MKLISNMSQAELAAYVQSHLRKEGITVVLSGGAAVAIYSSNKYVSADIDLVNVNFTDRRKIKKAMEEIGFKETDRHFTHPGTKHIVEYPAGPLSVGQEAVHQIDKIKFTTGILEIISPTDCVKDRLSAFYYWGDRQSLSQAIFVARARKIKLEEIRRWSKESGNLREFKIFLEGLQIKKEKSDRRKTPGSVK